MALASPFNWPRMPEDVDRRLQVFVQPLANCP